MNEKEKSINTQREYILFMCCNGYLKDLNKRDLKKIEDILTKGFVNRLNNLKKKEVLK